MRHTNDPRSLIRYALVGAAVTVTLMWVAYLVRDALLLIYMSALVAIGIVERDMLKQSRRYIYFAMSIVAAAITPGDVITATVALMFPLIGLFELGIWLSKERKETISADT